MKRILSIVLVMLLITSTLPMGVTFAEEGSPGWSEDAIKTSTGGVKAGTDYGEMADGLYTTSCQMENGEIILDFGGERAFNSLVLTEKNGNEAGYTVSYANDLNDTFTDLATGTFSATETVEHPYNHIHRFDKLVLARYIKITSVTSADICEISVFYNTGKQNINFANSSTFKSVYGRSQGSNADTIAKLLNHTATVRTNLGSLNAGGGKLATNTWMLVDLGASTDINRLEIARADMGLKTYTLYATNDPSVKATEATLGSNLNGAYNTNPYPVETLSSDWIVASGTLAEAEVNTSYEGRTIVDVIDFNSTVNARYLLFLVTDAYQPYAAHSRLWSFEVYNSYTNSDISLPTGVDYEFDASAYNSGNLFENANIIGGTYCIDGVAGLDKVVLTDGLKKDGNERFYLGGKDASVIFDMETASPVNKVVVYEYGQRGGKYLISGSDDGESWTSIKEINRTESSDYALKCNEFDFENVEFYRYIRLSAVGMTEMPILAEVEACCTIDSISIVNELDATDISDEPLSYIVSDIKALPRVVTNDIGSAAVAWTSSHPQIVNIETGEVERPATDTDVTLTALFTIEGEGSFSKKFVLTVRAEDTRELHVVKQIAASEFTDSVGGSIKNENEISIVGDAATKYTFVAENGFKVSETVVDFESRITAGELEVSFAEEVFKASEAGGTLTFSLDGEVVSSREVADGTMVKYQIRMLDGNMVVFADTGSGFSLVALKEGIEDGTFKEVQLKSTASGRAVLNNFTISAIKSSFLELIANQLTFDKLSTEKIMDVSKALTLIEGAYGVEFSYESENNAIINAKTGKVDFEEGGYCSIVASISFDGEVIEKNFHIAMDNLAIDKTVTTTATAVGATNAGDITDGKTETEFLANVPSYELLLDLGSVNSVRGVGLHEAVGGDDRISRVKVLLSSDGELYTEVKTASSVGEKLVLDFDARDAQYIKLVVTAPSGKTTGLSEMAVFYNPPEPTYSADAVNLAAGALLVDESTENVFTDGYYSTAQVLENGSITIDLGAEKLFNTILVTEKNGRDASYKVYGAASKDGEFTELASGNCENTESTSAYNHRHKLSQPTVARYIRISTTNSAELCEVSVFYEVGRERINFTNSNIFKDVTGRKQHGSSPTPERLFAHELTDTSMAIGWLHNKENDVNAPQPNTWFFVDLGAITEIDSLELTRDNDNIKSYILYATQDDTMAGIVNGLPVVESGYNKNPYPVNKLPSIDEVVATGNFERVTPDNLNYKKRKDVDFIPFTSAVKARYLLYYINGTYNVGASAGLWSFDIYNKGESLPTLAPGVESVFDSSAFELGNVMRTASVSGSEYCVDGVMGSDTKTLNDGIYGDGENCFYLGGNNAFATFDFGEGKAFNKIVVYEYGSKAGKYVVSISDNGKDWTPIKEFAQTASADNSLRYKELDFENLESGRFVKLEAVGMEGIPVIAEIEGYCTVNAVVVADSITAGLITDEYLDGITNKLLNLPETQKAFNEAGTTEYSANIEWLSDNAIVNADTGEVQRPEEDTEVTLTARFTFDGGITFDKKFVLLVKAEKATALETVKTVSAEEIADGEYIFSEENGFRVTPNGVVEFDAKLDKGFVEICIGKSTLKIAENRGKISFLVDDKTINSKTFTTGTNAKYRIEVVDGLLDVYADFDGNGYRLYVLEEMVEETEIKSVKADKNGGLAEVENLNISLRAEDVVNIVKEQLTFDKLSDDSIFNIKNPIRLIDKAFGASITYTSSNNEVLNPQTGAVNTEKSGYCDLVANISYDGRTVQRTYNTAFSSLTIGKKIYSNVMSLESTHPSNVIDGINETGLYVKASKYEMVVNLEKETLLSCVGVHELVQDKGSIAGISIQLSSDDITYTEVASSTTVGERVVFEFEPKAATYIKIAVTSVEGKNTGIREVTAFFCPSDEQLVNLEHENVKIGTFVSSGDVLPAVSENGSVYSYSCTDSTVNFVKNGDKYTIQFEVPSVSRSTTITVTTKFGTATKSTTYTTALQGKTDINQSIPDGGSGGGGGGGGGTGGGGGAGSSFSKPEVNPGTNPEQKPDTPTAPSREEVIKNELENHWAKSEIETLMEKGIVKGDNNGLNLAGTVTRAEFIAMIVRAMEFETVKFDGAFKDVKSDDWFADVLQTGFKNGVFSGFDGNANPNAKITREEAATMLVNVLKLTKSKESTFVDKGDISDWAADKIDAAAEAGLINGYEDGSFAPKKSMQRDESMAVIFRMLNIKTNDKAEAEASAESDTEMEVE